MINRRSLLLTALAPFIALAASHTRAQSYKLGTIEIGHPWAAPPTGDIAAVFMTLANMNGKLDRLVSASTPIADTVLFQESGDRPVAAFDLQPKLPVVLQPASRRIVLQGVKRPLAIGDAFPLTLRFAAAGSITVLVQVERGPAASTPSPAH